MYNIMLSRTRLRLRLRLCLRAQSGGIPGPSTVEPVVELYVQQGARPGTQNHDLG